jgi:hypothetical protein
LEFDQEGRALSLDQFTKTLLEAVQKIVRQELERWHVAHPVPVERLVAPPETKRTWPSRKRKPQRFLACEPQNHRLQHHSERNKVFRVGRRVLVPVESLEAIVKRGSLRTRGMDDSQDARS